MISRKPKKKQSNLHYRSARAVPSGSSQGKDKLVSHRCKWNLIKAVILISGVCLFIGNLYLPFVVDVKEQTHATNEHSPLKAITGQLKEFKNAVEVVENKVKKVVKEEVAVVKDHIPALQKAKALTKGLGRGLSGLPMSETPALVGAERGHIECEVDVDRLAYWNHPQGQADKDFKSPFIGTPSAKPKYITFEPDRGGWNNIRMNLEIMFIIAAATGRTLVLPPPVPMYLLNHDKGEKHKGFVDFYPIHEQWFQDRLEIITMEEFIKREGGEDGQFTIPEDKREKFTEVATGCDKRAKSKIACEPLFEYLEESADLVPQFNGSTCILFDEAKFDGNEMTQEIKEKVDKVCDKRTIHYYITSEFTDKKMVYFKNCKGWRIMAHFYGYMHFTNPLIGNHFKRFVRDFMHYNDQIYCAAGKIVLALQDEGQKRGFTLDDEQGGGYASLHVRRGDLQYKAVKISAEEWYDNLKDTFLDNEIIYIATDERNKTFFDPIKEHKEVRFLDDYWEMAKLGDLDPNYMGMIDTIVASRGRVFGGTLRSTFTGYINRMRGYHGMTMKNSYYSFLEKKNITHEWRDHYDGTTFAFEWPDGWIGIDGDKEPVKDKF